MRRAVVLIHEDFEGPARIAEILAEEGWSVDVRSLHRGDAVPSDLGDGEPLIVMGGPMGVGDRERPEYPYLAREIELLRRRAAADAPVLGVCLGAQLLAHAAGAAVRPMMTADGRARTYEVGFGPVRFHPHPDAGADDPILNGIPAEAMVLHWHGDAFDLPAGARRLASTKVCPNQAFQLGRRLFGIQFHCEASAEDIESFLREDGDFVTKANGAGGVERLRAETPRHLSSFREVGDRLLRNIVRAMA